MQKIIFLLLLLTAYSMPLFANNSNKYFNELSGTVTNQSTQEPLAGATIYIPDLKMGAVSDAKGEYKIQHLPTGKYLVQVRYAGFATVSSIVTIQDKTEKNWRLKPAVIEGREVVITGVSRATAINRQPTHISVLHHLELQRKTTDNIIGKIADMPGVNAVTTGPNVMKPVIRGLSANRVVVVDDGIRQEGQQWGAEHGIEVDAYSAGSIEVLRGAASLMYGSDALGGVVNILPSPPASQGKILGTLAGNYQTNNGLYALHADIRGNKNGFQWHANGTIKQAHDYKNKFDNYVFNSKFREKDFDLGVGLNRSWGYSHLSFSSYDLWLGLPEGERDSKTGKFLKEVATEDGNVEEEIATDHDFKSYSPMLGKQHVQHKKVTWDNKLFLDENSLDATFAFQQNTRKEFEDVLTPSIPGLYMQLNTFNYNVHYNFKKIQGWDVTTGINGMLQQNKNKGEEYLIPDYDLFEGGIYGIAQKTIRKFSFTGGLRVDWRRVQAKALSEDGKVRFSDFDKQYANISGSVGLAFQATPQLVVKANVSRGFRAPAMSELSANGIHEGTVRYELGDAKLKAETSLEFDAGAAFESEHVSASLYGYLNTIDHYIYSRKLLSYTGADSLTHTDEGDFLTFKYEQTKARLYGLEAAVDIHPHPLDWLHFKNTFSLVRGIRLNTADSTRNLPQIPAARLITELGFHFKRQDHRLQNVFLNFKLNNTFKQNHYMQAYRTETATSGYTLLDIEAGTHVANDKGKVLFSVFLSANNVTDVAYQDHLSRLKYLPVNEVTGRSGIFNMGRNFSFKIIVPLNF